MFKLALDAGHGLYTKGKEIPAYMGKYPLQKEWQLNSRICDYMQEMLKAYKNVEVLRLDDVTGKTDVTLKVRTAKANSWGADFLLSEHHNAGINGGTGGGVVVYTYPKTSKENVRRQKDLYAEIIKHTGLKGNRSTPIASANLHMVRESLMPAILIESGFMDSKTDVPIIITEEFAKANAKAQVEFLVEEFNLKPIIDKEHIKRLIARRNVIIRILRRLTWKST